MLNVLALALYYALTAAPISPLRSTSYAGRWEFRTDSTSFRLELQPAPDSRLPDGTYSPLSVLQGNYRFSRHGRVIEESFSQAQPHFPFAVLDMGYDNRITLTFQDQLGLNHRVVRLAVRAGHPDTLFWQQSYLIAPEPNDTRHARFTLPTSFKLVRVP